MRVDAKHEARLGSSYFCHHLLDRCGINTPGQLGAVALTKSTDTQTPMCTHTCEYQCGLTQSKQTSGKFRASASPSHRHRAKFHNFTTDNRQIVENLWKNFAISLTSLSFLSQCTVVYRYHYYYFFNQIRSLSFFRSAGRWRMHKSMPQARTRNSGRKCS